jgi:hypothetical protein
MLVGGTRDASGVGKVTDVSMKPVVAVLFVRIP